MGYVSMFESFDDNMNRLNNDFRESYFNDRPLPKVLYQYTNTHGLKGILDSKKWYATHSSYLNDPKEITYADEMMSEILESRLTALASDNILVRVYEEVLGKSYGKPSVLKAWDDDIYLISFSEDGNLLDQWRAYGDDGNGYSIGINPSILNNKLRGNHIFSFREGGLAFVKVSYDVAEQRSLILDLIEKVEQVIEIEYKSLRVEGRKLFPRVAAQSLSRIISQFALFYKNPAFKREQEWRVVNKRWGRNVRRRINADAVEGVLFRPSGNILIPYLELDFSIEGNPEILPIEKIYLGPRHKNTNGENSLEMYLLTLGYRENMPNLEISDIPYQ